MNQCDKAPERKGTHVTVNASIPSFVNFLTSRPPAPKEIPVNATNPHTLAFKSEIIVAPWE